MAWQVAVGPEAATALSWVDRPPGPIGLMPTHDRAPSDRDQDHRHAPSSCRGLARSIPFPGSRCSPATSRQKCSCPEQLVGAAGAGRISTPGATSSRAVDDAESYRNAESARGGWVERVFRPVRVLRLASVPGASRTRALAGATASALKEDRISPVSTRRVRGSGQQR